MSRNLTFVSRALTEDRVQNQKSAKFPISVVGVADDFGCNNQTKCKSSYKRHRFVHFIVQSVGAITRKV